MAILSSLKIPLCTLAVAVFAATAIQAHPRVHLLVDQTEKKELIPGTDPSKPTWGVDSLAVAHDSIYFSLGYRPELYQIKDGMTNLVQGSGPHGEFIIKDSPVASTQGITAILPLRDQRTILVARRHQIWRIELGLPVKVSVFAGTDEAGDVVTPSALTTQFTYVSSMVERMDGGIVVADALAGRLVELRPAQGKGAWTASILAGTGMEMLDGTPSSTLKVLLNPIQLVQMQDGSLLVSAEHSVLRIDPSGVATDMLNGPDLLNYSGQHGEIAALQDGSFLILANEGQSLIRIAGTGLEAAMTLFAGQNDSYLYKHLSISRRLDPAGIAAGTAFQFDSARRQAEFGQMVVLPDNSVVCAVGARLFLISPSDAFQTDLETMVRQALKEGPAAFESIQKELERLAGITKGDVIAEGVGDWLTPFLVKDLIRLTQAYHGETPWLQLRARFALEDLGSSKRAATSADSSDSSSSSSSSSQYKYTRGPSGHR